MSPEDAKHVSDMVPKRFNIPVSIKEAIVESEKFAIFAKQNEKIVEIAQKLENLIKNTGIHASGIAISHENIEETIPLERCKDDDSGEEGVVTGFEMGDVGSLIVKVDVLGLKTLSVVNDTCKDIGVDPNNIPKEDPETYKFLQNLVAPQGLFQIETETGFRVCQKVRPRDLHDLAAILAIARPGALAYADKYAEFVNTGESQSVHPFFDSVLGRTGNIPIFQEQLLAMLNKIGLSLIDADRVRKCVGKKLVEEMKEWQGKIYETAEKNGLDKSVGDVVWKVADESKNYSFCLSPDSIVDRNGEYVCIKDINKGDEVLAFDVETEKNHYVKVLNKFETKSTLYKFSFEDGREITCSMDHKFLCSDKKMRKIKDILKNNYEIVCNNEGEQK